MQNYDWQCHVCFFANLARDDICGKCGFPARASGRDILAARTAKEHPNRVVFTRTPDALERLSIELQPLPLWRKTFAIFGLVFAFGGGILLKVTFSWTEALIGFAMLVTGMATFGLATYCGTNRTDPSTRDAIG